MRSYETVALMIPTPKEGTIECTGGRDNHALVALLSCPSHNLGVLVLIHMVTRESQGGDGLCSRHTDQLGIEAGQDAGCLSIS
jgi:hypothetical protein